MNDLTLLPIDAEASPLNPITSPLSSLVLTAKGGRFEIKDELRQVLALTADGVLHISDNYLSDQYVMAFIDQLEHEAFDFRIQSASMVQIKSLYDTAAQHAGQGSQAETLRQAQALELIGHAHDAGASDIHIVVGHDITKIFYRVHGLLWEARQEKSEVGNELCSALYNSMCDVSKDHYQAHIPQDARVSRRFVEQLGLFGARIATRPLVDGPLMIMRLLYDDASKQTLEELGFLPEQIEHFARLRSLPYGVNLFTGPTGSGKSKSLQVNLNLLFDETEGTRHILTLENPPEYRLKANQSALGAAETWSEAITNTVRLDPDVLMYGELRDLASAQAAYTGGMTGHQVWSTLHTNDAIAAIPRLIDMGVPQYLVTDPALTTGIINQSLLPVLCPHCKVPLLEHQSALDKALFNRLAKLHLVDQAFLTGEGCSQCKGMAVVDRTVAAEMLLTDLLFMKVFTEQGASAARRHWVKEMGGITKISHARMKIAAGIVDPRHAETMVGPLDFDQQLVELSHA